MNEFRSKVDSTFICNTVQIKHKKEFKYEFQLKDTKEKSKDFFGTHKRHEFALSLGKKHFTFYIRLWFDKFEEKKDFTYLKVTPTNSKNKEIEKSKKEGYIKEVKSPEDINELINFIFFKCLGNYIEKPINKKIETIKSQEKYRQELEKEIEESIKLTKNERLKKSANYNKIPKQIIINKVDYQRNPFVIIDALKRAKGKCEKCNKDAPFIRDKNNSPYLEVHHKIPLSEKGEDTLKNVAALCPNCHRHAHYGKSTY
ncbi:hypothetical protein BTO15_14650 [Polaribacter sejongensis]|nr:hypothetical protein BTO15_14650 [Polaribacter sejongensis]